MYIILYFIGTLIAFYGLRPIFKYIAKDEGVEYTYGHVVITIMLSLLSWITILAAIFVYIGAGIVWLINKFEPFLRKEPPKWL